MAQPAALRPEDVPRFPPQDEHGVDLWQIEDNLRLTPAERLERHHQFRAFVQEMRRAGEQFYGSPHPDTQEAPRYLDTDLGRIDLQGELPGVGSFDQRREFQGPDLARSTARPRRAFAVAGCSNAGNGLKRLFHNLRMERASAVEGNNDTHRIAGIDTVATPRPEQDEP
jgi:hypothetical protein